jgi:hypothetical protein
MDECTIMVPEEYRLLVVLGEEREIEVRAEWRYIEVPADGSPG